MFAVETRNDSNDMGRSKLWAIEHPLKLGLVTLIMKSMIGTNVQTHINHFYCKIRNYVLFHAAHSKSNKLYCYIISTSLFLP